MQYKVSRAPNLLPKTAQTSLPDPMAWKLPVSYGWLCLQSHAQRHIAVLVALQLQDLYNYLNCFACTIYIYMFVCSIEIWFPNIVSNSSVMSVCQNMFALFFTSRFVPWSRMPRSGCMDKWKLWSRASLWLNWINACRNSAYICRWLNR